MEWYVTKGDVTIRNNDFLRNTALQRCCDMVATLFQYWNAMLQWKSSLQIVSCNITVKAPPTKVPLECYTFTASVVYHFCSETILSKVRFSNPRPQNAQIVNLKNQDLDLIRRIHPECGFYGFMICSWFSPRKLKIRFWIRKSWFGFSQPVWQVF